MTEIFIEYLPMGAAVAVVIVLVVAWVLDQNLDTGYRPGKHSDQALRDVEKLLREANK